MKRLLFILILINFNWVSAQDKYSTKTGRVDFEASVPSFEEVKAKNENVSAILNIATGEFASLALMNAFRFKVALMEEHFNENYMESSKYPKAVFKGTIKDFDLAQLNNSPAKFNLVGSITVHGETKPMDTTVLLYKKDSAIIIDAVFEVKPEDFRIEIPKVVSNKIAETINVSVHYELSN
jgi:YceI-like domain